MNQLQTVLDALENGIKVRNCEGGTEYQPPLEAEAIAIVKQMMQAEPVAGIYENRKCSIGAPDSRDIENGWSPLYTAPQAAPAWLPISSAPKDGTMFDGWNGERVADVTWAHPSYSATGHRAWCAREYTNWDSVEVTGLTHWLPIPSAPKDTP
jgi:hypothetical protein